MTNLFHENTWESNECTQDEATSVNELIYIIRHSNSLIQFVVYSCKPAGWLYIVLQANILRISAEDLTSTI